MPSGTTSPAQRPGSWIGTWRHPREWAQVALILGFLVAGIYGTFLLGRSVPPGDFLGSYNGEAYAWWHDGGFFAPPQWMPYLWGGYPAAASAQNSSFYLPVGLVALVVPFTPWAASVLYVAHVVFGALGAYTLVRRNHLGTMSAKFALVAYFFAVGFTSNAQHVDIVRGFAWAPWLFLIASPSWPWRRWWSIPVAALALWQAAVGSYPGIVVFLAYGIGAWVLVLVLSDLPAARAFLLKAGVSALCAVLLTLPKYVPLIALRGTSARALAGSDVMDLGVLSTLVFPYGDPHLSGEESMRSLFVVAPVLVLLVLAPWRLAMVRAAAAVLAVQVILGPPDWPWSGLVENLPGMALSRFQMADSRVLEIVALTVLASAALRDACVRQRSPQRNTARALLVRMVVVAASVPLAAVVAISVGFTATQWLPSWVLYGLSAGVVCVLCAGLAGRIPYGARATHATAWCLIGLALVSGVAWVEQSPGWKTGRAGAQARLWGAPVRDLIADRRSQSAPQRPARTPLPDGASAKDAVDRTWDGAYYSGIPAVGGYVNLSGNPAYETLLRQLAPATSGNAVWRAFWAAPGLLVPADGVLTEPGIARCAQNGHCAGIRVTPVAYRPGVWTYEVDAVRATTVAANEPFYPGLTATVCGPAGCRAAAVTGDKYARATFPVPAGVSQVTLGYATPHQGASWIAFGVGVAMCVGAPLWWARRNRVGDGRGSRAGRSTDARR